MKHLKKAIVLLATNIEMNGISNIMQYNDFLKSALEEGDLEAAKKLARLIDDQANITYSWLKELAQLGHEVPITYTDFIHSEK